VPAEIIECSCTKKGKNMLEKDDLKIIEKLVKGCGMRYQQDSWGRIKKMIEEKFTSTSNQQQYACHNCAHTLGDSSLCNDCLNVGGYSKWEAPEEIQVHGEEPIERVE